MKVGLEEINGLTNHDCLDNLVGDSSFDSSEYTCNKREIKNIINIR